MWSGKIFKAAIEREEKVNMFFNSSRVACRRILATQEKSSGDYFYFRQKILVILSLFSFLPRASFNIIILRSFNTIIFFLFT